MCFGELVAVPEKLFLPMRMPLAAAADEIRKNCPPL
jgi:hypothetical protein